MCVGFENDNVLVFKNGQHLSFEEGQYLGFEEGQRLVPGPMVGGGRETNTRKVTILELSW